MIDPLIVSAGIVSNWIENPKLEDMPKLEIEDLIEAALTLVNLQSKPRKQR